MGALHCFGIKCKITGCRTLFILGVYLPSTYHTTEELQEYLDLLWALYESLLFEDFVNVTRELNEDFGNTLGYKSKKCPATGVKYFLTLQSL